MGHSDYKVLQRYVRLANGTGLRLCARMGRVHREQPGAGVVVFAVCRERGARIGSGRTVINQCIGLKGVTLVRSETAQPGLAPQLRRSSCGSGQPS